MTQLYNLPSRLISLLCEQLSPKDVRLIAEDYGERSGNEKSLYDQLTARAGFDYVARSLVLHAMYRQDLMGLIHVISEHLPELRKTIDSLGFKLSSMIQDYLAALLQELGESVGIAAESPNMRYVIKNTNAFQGAQVFRPNSLSWLSPTSSDSVLDAPWLEVSLDKFLISHPHITLQSTTRSGISTILHGLVKQLATAWQTSESTVPFPVFSNLRLWINPKMNLMQFLQSQITWLGIPQLAEQLPDLIGTGRIMLLLDGLGELPYIKPNEKTGLFDDPRLYTISRLGEDSDEYKVWRKVKCILGRRDMDIVIGPYWYDLYLLDPSLELLETGVDLPDDPAQILDSFVKKALETEIASGDMTGAEVVELQTRLGCLALNITEARKDGPGDTKAKLASVNKNLAASWLFHPRMQEIKKDDQKKFSEPEASQEEQQKALRLLLFAQDAGLLTVSTDLVHFSHQYIQNYFCVFNSLSQSLDDPQFMARVSQYQFREMWWLWSKFDHQLVTKLIVLLKNSDSSNLRNCAACALSWLGDSRAVEPLISALRDESAKVRWNAAYALGSLGDNRAVEPLIATLNDIDPYVRQWAVRALGMIEDDRRIEPLIQALRDEDPDVRFFVTEVMKELRDERFIEPLVALLAIDGWNKKPLIAFGEAAVPALMNALNPEFHRGGEVAFNAAEILGEIGDIRPLTLLIWMSGNDWREDGGGEKVKKAAAEAMIKIENRHRLAVPLVAALGSDDNTISVAAAFALGKLGDRRAVEPLLTALKNENELVRFGAASLLGSIGDTSAIGPLIATLQYEDEVLQGATDALHKFGELAVAPLIEALKDENQWLVRYKAAEILGYLMDTRAVDPLIAALTDEDWHVRWAAINALSLIGDKRALEPLLAAAQDAHRDVRKNVPRAIHAIDPAQAVEVLLAALQDEDGDIRCDAARELIKLGDRRAVGSLIIALQDDDFRVRKLAALALKNHGDGQAVQPLIEALQDKEEDVVRYAAEALGAIGDIQAVVPLLEVLNNVSFVCCSAAAKALIGFGEFVTPSLLAALKDEGPGATFYSWTPALQADLENRRRFSNPPLSLIENSHLHFYSARILGKVGDIRALPMLMWMAENDHNETRTYGLKVRDEAAKGVEIIRQKCQKNVELITGLEHPDPAVRVGAAFALGILGDGRAVEVLNVALTDVDRRVRWGAARQLGNIGGEQAIAALSAALEDEDSDVRRSGIIALLTIGDEQAIAALNIVYKDQESDIRKRIVASLANLGNIAIPQLIVALEDEDQENRNAAATALIKLDEAAIPALIANLREKQSNTHDWLWFEEIAYVLSQMGETALQPLLAALKDQDSNMRYWVANALGDLGNKQAAGSLTSALKDEDPFVRLSVASALTKLGDDQGFELLLEALKEADENIRVGAILNLRETRSDRAIEPLIATLNDEDKDIRYLAVIALRDIGDGRALPALERLVKITKHLPRVPEDQGEQLADVPENPREAVADDSQADLIDDQLRMATRQAIQRIQERQK